MIESSERQGLEDLPGLIVQPPGWIPIWGDIFVKHDLRNRLGISFEIFLKNPHAWIANLRGDNDPPNDLTKE